jgi:hypothetical protein
MKGYLAYSGVLNPQTTTSALSRARTRSMLTLISRPAPGGEPQPPATPKRQRKPKASNTDAVQYGWMPSAYRAAA